MHYLISFPILETRKSEQLIILVKDLCRLAREDGRLHLSSHLQKHYFISLLVSLAPPNLGPLSFHLPRSGAGPSLFPVSAAAGSIGSSLQVEGRKRKPYIFMVLGKMHRTERCRRSGICLPGWQGRRGDRGQRGKMPMTEALECMLRWDKSFTCSQLFSQCPDGARQRCTRPGSE